MMLFLVAAAAAATRAAIHEKNTKSQRPNTKNAFQLL